MFEKIYYKNKKLITECYQFFILGDIKMKTIHVSSERNYSTAPPFCQDEKLHKKEIRGPHYYAWQKAF